MVVAGTGALVLDRAHKVAYCALSHRAHLTMAKRWASALNYQLVPFITNEHHQSVYHTNVALTIGADFAIICADVRIAARPRSEIRTRLAHRSVNVDGWMDELCRCCTVNRSARW